MMGTRLRTPGFLFLATLVMALFFVSACGSSSTSAPAEEATAVPANTSAPAPTSAGSGGGSSGGAAVTATPPPDVQPAMMQAMAKPEGKRGGVIPVQNAGNVAHWSMMECGSGGTCMAPTSPIYNGLVQYNGETDDPGDIRGDLATGWTLSEDGMSFVFTLPENARWHDGQPVTADDVVFSLQEMTRDDVPRPRSGQISPYYESSRALDPFTVEVNLKFAASAFLPFLATDFMKMWPKHHVGSDPATQLDMRLEENILGSGPFKMVNYDKDVVIEYERNDDYFKEGLPYFDGMQYFVINDSSRVLAAYKAGQTLLTSYLNSNMNIREAQELAEANEGKGTVYFAGPAAWIGMLINTKSEPFDDVRVRQALQLVLHRQAFVEIFGAGRYPVGAPFPPDQWFSPTTDELLQLPGIRETDEGEKHPDDIARAQELMAEAGYPDGFETTILAANFLGFPDMAQVAADQMKRWLNIDAIVQPEEPAAGYVRYEGGDWKLGFHGNGFLVLDPDAIIAGSYVTTGTRNYSKWEPAKITELNAAQQTETDLDKRRELVLEMNDYILNQDTPFVITHWTLLAPYVDNQIKNYHIASVFPAHTMKEHLWFEEN